MKPTLDRAIAAAREATIRAQVEKVERLLGAGIWPITTTTMELRHLLADLDRLTRERDEARAERDALAKLLLRAGDALVCNGDLMSDSDEWQESHACGRCDERVDRNWVIRTEIRAALAQIEKERSDG